MRLAIFDIDGTIFRSSLVIELCQALVKAGVFPAASAQEIQKEYLAWLDRKGSYEAYINKVVKIYIKYIKGQRFSLVKRISQNIIKQQKDRTYRFTRGLIKRLKKENYFLLAISGSPSYIVESYARATGFDQCFGTQLEVKNGFFTAKVKNLDSAFNKAKVLKDFARLKGEKNINWKQSVAVGDTEGDTAMLSLVGRPIAFNPNMHLAKIAKRKKWRIVVERKDTVFELKDFTFLQE